MFHEARARGAAPLAAPAEARIEVRAGAGAGAEARVEAGHGGEEPCTECPAPRNAVLSLRVVQ